MDTKSGFADVNGTRLHYRIDGRGDALVLIHGVTLDLRMWDAQVEGLTRGFRVLRYDVRGFGQSAIPEGPYDHADDLNTLLDFLEIPHAHILGLSMGGRIALNFALKYPERLHSLIVADTGLEGYVFREGNPAAAVVAKAKESGIDSAKHAWLEHPIFATTRRHPAAFELVRTMVASYSGWHWLNNDLHTPAEPKAITQLQCIRVPTLVITGESSMADYHCIKDILCRDISGARSAVIPKAGHLSNMEAPGEFNELVVACLRTIK